MARFPSRLTRRPFPVMDTFGGVPEVESHVITHLQECHGVDAGPCTKITTMIPDKMV